AYRAGLAWTRSPRSQWRFGYVYDETPQPEEAVGPLLPDADRNGITVGYGYRGRWDFDVALMYLEFDERTREKTFATPPGAPPEPVFHGTYETTGFLLGLTLGH
ncbi:MAG TPA: outer membrane protein transport protein, partial [Thermoanaerobaculia bacterium]|nr:outer membrane protein transport protein [Thermoanaerobaculia bacterium]